MTSPRDKSDIFYSPDVVRKGNINRPSVVDLFCGAGGLSLGFATAGCTIIGAVDLDEVAGETYRTNISSIQSDSPINLFFGENGNIENLNFQHVNGDIAVDLLIGGPPCQGFSKLGRAKLDSLSDEGFKGDPRNTLYRRFVDAVRFWKPQAFLMENVIGMLSVGGRNVAEEAAGELADCGYNVGYAVLNAVWYGVPQLRERLFFLGYRQDLNIHPEMPIVSHNYNVPRGYIQDFSNCSEVQLPLPLFNGLSSSRKIRLVSSSHGLPAVTVADALSDLPAIISHLNSEGHSGHESRPPILEYRGEPATGYTLMRNWPGLTPGKIEDHEIRLTPRDYETFRQMKSGDRYPEALKISEQRFQTELQKSQSSGKVHIDGSSEWEEFRRRFIPPYPVNMFLDKWRKLDPGRPSWTVTAHLAKDSYSHIHYDSLQARAISIREAARLQSFPDSFRFYGNMGDRFRQIGNAVPPLVSWAIASMIIQKLGYHAQVPPWSVGESLSPDSDKTVTKPKNR
ncbi:DNA cytosine methyltransferase [Candidatus Manganitrophus noduliformans]|uniref:Cytosine-specific methyltransferase n=1 Tax=Candidatus Manganitrophus noduliformans TaxID=2606439 RepID=A0A7X6IB25_9BACT|nr:DNA cytosine methyltransferase [Candidatus Manganitrophus noduliformans]NKE71336.1 DNA cytosine methyltransferase [Candidatus Manganitrophus noduliformans]